MEKSCNIVLRIIKLYIKNKNGNQMLREKQFQASFIKIFE